MIMFDKLEDTLLRYEEVLALPLEKHQNPMRQKNPA